MAISRGTIFLRCRWIMTGRAGKQGRVYVKGTGLLAVGNPGCARVLPQDEV